MSYNAWMPLQGTNTQQTTGKNYGYSAKKSTKGTRDADKSANMDSMWKLAAESYEPSAAAKQYRANQTSARKTGAADSNLSSKAKKLLEELKEKYSNMDFYVASYSSDEEARKYLNRGSKEYSVLIDPETLEAMANDADVRKQYEDVLAGAGGKFEEMREELGEDADQVKSFGISIDSKGNVSYFAELDKISESRQKQVESAKSKRAEEKAKAAKEAKQEEAKERMEEWKSGNTEFVKADSMEELIAKIKDYMSGAN